MATEKAIALVVRTTDWSETSRIATLWSREFGKMRVLAKGGRRLKSNFEVALDLLTVCNVVAIRKQQGGLDLLTEAQVSERFPALSQNLAALYGGYYIAELLSEGTEDGDPHPALFDATLEALRELGSAGPLVGQRLLAYELTWLDEVGYRPALAQCAACGGEAGDRPAISASAGGVVCDRCSPMQRERRALSRSALTWLRSTEADPDAWRKPCTPAVQRELRQVMGQYITYRMGRRLRTLPFVTS